MNKMSTKNSLREKKHEDVNQKIIKHDLIDLLQEQINSLAQILITHILSEIYEQHSKNRSPAGVNSDESLY